MIRQTSIDVYNQIKSEGLLAKLEWHVYQTLFNHGPLTQGETWKEYSDPEYMRHSIGPTFARLAKNGCIKEVGRRNCRLTNRNVLLWDVTNNLPSEMEKSKVDIRWLCNECERHFKSNWDTHPSKDQPLFPCKGKLKKYKECT